MGGARPAQGARAARAGEAEHASTPRAGRGWATRNNKGNPVKQYEPFFSATSDFEDEDVIVQTGVTPIIHYDPLDRVIRTELPDGSESRVEFDAWLQKSFDPNDAIAGTRWLSEHQAGTADEQRAAALALTHANTPTIAHLDALGRSFLVQADNGTDPNDPGLHDTRTAFDIEGNVLAIRDARGITADSNRLQHTSVPGSELSLTETYLYDEHGSMTKMPHLAALDWDYADRLQHTRKTNGDVQDTYFTYDAAGQRVRKVFVTAGAIKERIYLGGYEVYRERANLPGSIAMLERQTLHVMDDQRRAALVETKTRDGGSDIATPAPLWRFQLDNHLGSSMVELDHQGGVISYEEYHPYGSTAFQIATGSGEVSAKRYRYTSKERDEETGLYYHGARYYAPWLARWTAVDPLRGRNPYEYVSGRPVVLRDPNGADEEPGFWDTQVSYWKGVAEGAGELASGLKQAASHPVETAKAIGQVTSQAYEQDGVVGAVNVFNPLYHAAVAGVEYAETHARRASKHSKPFRTSPASR